MKLKRISESALCLIGVACLAISANSTPVAAVEVQEPVEVFVETVIPEHIPAEVEIIEEPPVVIPEQSPYEIMPMVLIYQGEVLPECPYWHIFDQYGEEFGISPELLAAISWYESSFNADMKKNGYRGLFSLSMRWCEPEFKAVQGVDWNDPADNTRTACALLSEFYSEFGETVYVLHRFHGEKTIYKNPSAYASRIMTLADKYEHARGKR